MDELLVRWIGRRCHASVSEGISRVSVSGWAAGFGKCVTCVYAGLRVCVDARLPFALASCPTIIGLWRAIATKERGSTN